MKFRALLFVSVLFTSVGCGVATPLIDAVIEGNVRKVKRLLKPWSNVQRPDSDGKTALYHAARLKHVDIAELLIDRGALSGNCNAEMMTSESIQEAEGYDQKEAIDALLDAKSEWRLKSKRSSASPLVAAIQTPNNEEMIELLLENGAWDSYHFGDLWTEVNVAMEMARWEERDGEAGKKLWEARENTKKEIDTAKEKLRQLKDGISGYREYILNPAIREHCERWGRMGEAKMSVGFCVTQVGAVVLSTCSIPYWGYTWITGNERRSLDLDFALMTYSNDQWTREPGQPSFYELWKIRKESEAIMKLLCENRDASEKSLEELQSKRDECSSEAYNEFWEWYQVTRASKEAALREKYKKLVKRCNKGEWRAVDQLDTPFKPADGMREVDDVFDRVRMFKEIVDGDLEEVKSSIKDRLVPAKAKDRHGNLAIAVAAEHGHEDIVDYLASEGAPKEFPSRALYKAVEEGKVYEVERLMKLGADPTKGVGGGESPLAYANGIRNSRRLTLGAMLHWLVERGERQTINAILESNRRPDFESLQNDEGDIPILAAIKRGDDKTARTLAGRGKRETLFTKDKDGKSVLQYARDLDVKRGNTLSGGCLHKIVKAANDLNKTIMQDDTSDNKNRPYEEGHTLLHYAVSHHHAADAGLICLVDEEPQAKENEQTALHLACERNNSSAVAHMIRSLGRNRDANYLSSVVRKKNEEHYTPLHWAIEKNNCDAAATIIRELEKLKELGKIKPLDEKVSTNDLISAILTKLDPNDKTILHRACEKNMVEVVKAITETKWFIEIQTGVRGMPCIDGLSPIAYLDNSDEAQTIRSLLTIPLTFGCNEKTAVATALTITLASDELEKKLAEIKSGKTDRGFNSVVITCDELESPELLARKLASENGFVVKLVRDPGNGEKVEDSFKKACDIKSDVLLLCPLLNSTSDPHGSRLKALRGLAMKTVTLDGSNKVCVVIICKRKEVIEQEVLRDAKKLHIEPPTDKEVAKLVRAVASGLERQTRSNEEVSKFVYQLRGTSRVNIIRRTEEYLKDMPIPGGNQVSRSASWSMPSNHPILEN